MVLTFIWIKPSADRRTFFMNLTAIFIVKVFTPVLNIKVPFAFLDKDRSFLVTYIPADVLKVISGCRLINFQGKIFTTECIALFTGDTHNSSLKPKG
jgi:hypothetical protein